MHDVIIENPMTQTKALHHPEQVYFFQGDLKGKSKYTMCISNTSIEIKIANQSILFQIAKGGLILL